MSSDRSHPVGRVISRFRPTSKSHSYESRNNSRVRIDSNDRHQYRIDGVKTVEHKKRTLITSLERSHPVGTRTTGGAGKKVCIARCVL